MSRNYNKLDEKAAIAQFEGENRHKLFYKVWKKYNVIKIRHKIGY